MRSAVPSIQQRKRKKKKPQKAIESLLGKNRSSTAPFLWLFVLFLLFLLCISKNKTSGSDGH